MLVIAVQMVGDYIRHSIKDRSLYIQTLDCGYEPDYMDVGT